MKRYIQICTENLTKYNLKETLVHYRNIFQHKTIETVEAVIVEFQDLVEKRFNEIFERDENEAKKLLEGVDDLDKEKTTATLYEMALMQDEENIQKGEAQMHSEEIIRALEFVWFSYRIVIDLLKINSKMLKCYENLVISVSFYTLNIYI